MPTIYGASESIVAPIGRSEEEFLADSVRNIPYLPLSLPSGTEGCMMHACRGRIIEAVGAPTLEFYGEGKGRTYHYSHLPLMRQFAMGRLVQAARAGCVGKGN